MPWCHILVAGRYAIKKALQDLWYFIYTLDLQKESPQFEKYTMWLIKFLMKYLCKDTLFSWVCYYCKGCWLDEKSDSLNETKFSGIHSNSG